MIEYDGVEIAPRLRLAPQVWGRFEAAGLAVDLTAELQDGRYVCTRLELSPLNGGAPGVKSELVRELPIATLVEEAARQEWLEQELADRFQSAREEQATPDEVLAEYVAAAYRYGYALGARPTHVVVQLLGLSRPSAGRWIAAARQLNYLAPTQQGAAGGVNLSQNAPGSLPTQAKVIQTRLAELERRWPEAPTSDADSPREVVQALRQHHVRKQQAVEADRLRLARLHERMSQRHVKPPATDESGH